MGIPSAFFTVSIWISLVIATFGPATVMAHGPGMQKVTELTAEISALGESSDLYVERARVFQDNQHWQEALSDYDRAARLDPSYTEYDLDRARLFYATGEYLSALDFVNLYLLRQHSTTEALLTKARIHVRLDQHADALFSYQQALDDLSGIDGRPLPEWYVEFADSQVIAGNKIEALQVLEQGIEELGEIVVFQIAAVNLEVELGRYSSALRRIDQLLDRSQRKDIWLTRRADILLAAGRDDEAQETYRQAYSTLQRYPLRLQNQPVSKELAATLQSRIKVKQ